MVGGTDKFKQGSHYCRTPLRKKAGKVWVCRCGARFTCQEVRTGKGKTQLVWLQTGDGRWK